MQVDELVELSGLVASQRNPGLFWAHNDSGSAPFIYCLRLSGASCGSWEIGGASAIDWEDIAAAPGRRGEPALYIGDIGDNDSVRDSVTVYRVPEPDVQGDSLDASATLAAETLTFSYPGRPHDAETLIVRRETGDLYVVTKRFASRSEVFVARAPLRDGQTFERVDTIEIDGLLTARTGGDISPDGSSVVLATYGDGYELRLPDGAPFDDIWKQEPVRVDLGDHRQNEAVTYTRDGKAIVSVGEGAGAPIYSVSRR